MYCKSIYFRERFYFGKKKEFAKINRLENVHIDTVHCTFSPVLQSAKINRRENANEDKNVIIRSRENKLIYIFWGDYSDRLRTH